jgi:uncharacterized protein YlxW (UPF0749 family)
MLIEIWKDVLMKVAMEKFSPVALKVLSNPQVQSLLTQVLNLQADMRQNIEQQVKLVARSLELVTKDEVQSLREVIKELEAEVEKLKTELKEAREKEKNEKETAETTTPQAEEPKEKKAPKKGKADKTE